MALDFLKIPDDDAVRVPADALREQVASIFVAAGTPEQYAQITADALTLASLRGVDTHGATNVVRYTESILEGTFKSPQEIEVISESDTTALLSCGWGLGHPAAHIGMEMAMDKAAEHGVGMSTIRDGHHIGMVAYYAMLAAETRHDRHRDDERRPGSKTRTWDVRRCWALIRLLSQHPQVRRAILCSTWLPRRSPAARSVWHANSAFRYLKDGPSVLRANRLRNRRATVAIIGRKTRSATRVNKVHTRVTDWR